MPFWSVSYDRKTAYGDSGESSLTLKKTYPGKVSSPGCYPLLDVMARTVAALL